MTEQPKTKIYDLQRTLTFRLARMQAKLNTQASDLVERHCGLSLTEWRILTVLSDPEVKTQKDVLKSMGIDKGQISRTIKKLLGQSLISSEENKTDNRLQMLSLTDEAWTVLKKMKPIMTKRQNYIRRELSDAELMSLISMIDRIEANAIKLNERDFQDD